MSSNAFDCLVRELEEDEDYKAVNKAIEAMRIAGGSEEFQAAFDAAKGLALCSELIGEPTRDVLANPEETSDCHGPDWTERDGEYLK